jgi:cell wall-associated NlpC family hydrolase
VSVVAVSSTAAPPDPTTPAGRPPAGFATALATLQAASASEQPGTLSGQPVAARGAVSPSLRTQLDPTLLPSVSLGAMVQALAGSTGITAPAARFDALAGADRVPAVAAPAAASASAILAAGERYLGVPYRWGGTDPADGFDCSGFVQRVFADLGVSLPRVSVDQAKAGTAVPSLEQARPGDLVFWYADGKRPNHIGIYAGDGRMLVAPRTGDVVRYQQLGRTPHEIRRVT